MKSKTKSIIVLTSTLILGIIIGILISAGIVSKRFHNFKRLTTPEGFRNRLNEIVQPDSVQAVKLDKLMSEFRKRFKQLHSNMKNQIDTMHSELSKVLTKAQMQNLERQLFRRKFRPFMHNKGDFIHKHRTKMYNREKRGKE